MTGRKFFIFKLALVSFLFLAKLEYSQAWLGFSFMTIQENNDFNCSALNLTNCTVCSPGTIYNNSNTILLLVKNHKNQL